MKDLIPAFDFHAVFVTPWQFYLWPMVMGFLVTAACGLVGNYLLLRRMALVGDALSHSVLPGLAIAFLFTNSRGTVPMFVGALAAGLVTTLLIDVIHQRSRVKQDAAIGIAFTTLFALGVVLIAIFADRVDLDQECVLYGEIGFVELKYGTVELFGLGIPVPVFRMGAVLLGTAALIVLFYKELLVTSFDPGLAVSLGISAAAVHYGLMALLSLVVVSAFESVGAVLVVAMLIIPGATVSLLADRLPTRLGLTILHAALSAVSGTSLAVWLNCSIAGAMVVMAAALFVLAWIFSPSQGLLWRVWRRSGNGQQGGGNLLVEANG